METGFPARLSAANCRRGIAKSARQPDERGAQHGKAGSCVESHFTPQLQLLPTTSDLKYDVFCGERIPLVRGAVSAEAVN